jgi:dodecin
VDLKDLHTTDWAAQGASLAHLSGGKHAATREHAQTEDAMAKRQAESVYRIVDVVGESSTSWEDAGRRAVETAATSIRDLRLAEVVKMDMKIENGKVTAFRTRVALSFKYEA